MDTRVALELIAAAAAALDAAWSQPHAPGEPALRLLHRRLRPTCVRVLPTGAVNVLEVGWYGAEGRPHTTWSDGCAPEETFGEPATASGDVYALGALLFGLLAGDDFGPSGLRQVEHEDRFERRFKGLAAVREFRSAEIEDAVHDVLYDMLAYGPQDRPTAAQVASRLRVIARRLQEPTLAGWASVAVPAIADAVDRFERARTNVGMAGRSVEEAPFDGSAEAGKGTVPPSIPADQPARPVVAAGLPNSTAAPVVRGAAPPVRVISRFFAFAARRGQLGGRRRRAHRRSRGSSDPAAARTPWRPATGRPRTSVGAGDDGRGACRGWICRAGGGGPRGIRRRRPAGSDVRDGA